MLRKIINELSYAITDMYKQYVQNKALVHYFNELKYLKNEPESKELKTARDQFLKVYNSTDFNDFSQDLLAYSAITLISTAITYYSYSKTNPATLGCISYGSSAIPRFIYSMYRNYSLKSSSILLVPYIGFIGPLIQIAIESKKQNPYLKKLVFKPKKEKLFFK